MRFLSMLTIISLISVMVLNSGCMTAYHIGKVKDEIRTERILASGNKESIDLLRKGARPKDVVRVTPLPEGGAVLSADILALSDPTVIEAIKRDPWGTAGWALADGATGAGIYYLFRYLDDSSSGNDGDSSETNTDSGRDSTVIQVNGDNNDVTVQNDQSQNSSN